MAWRSSGRTHRELIENLKAHGIIRSKSVFDAMLSVDRGLFSPRDPYEDRPQTIGYNATISAPHMHAYALEALVDNLKPGMSVLDVGSGSGYLAACMALMVGKEGKVVGIEHVTELTSQAIENVKKCLPEYLESGALKLVTGDGRKGCKDYAPFHAIHVGAAYHQRPTELLEQLKEGGLMFIPIGDHALGQEIRLYHKVQGEIKEKSLMGVMYVPLTSLDQQLFEY
jgi:protein-L-isoaspartate(D-aspartate) O-methyltransferase